jgi:GT2 family glycosyltransferase
MIFIIIPVFNRKEFTRKCLYSLNKQTYKDFETIVVDDGSTDGTSEMISREFPMVSILKGDGSLWWAGATNKGIEEVIKHKTFGNADYILTLNNDLELPEDYLDKLIYHVSVNKRVVLGSVSVDIDSNDHLDFCGIRWNEFTGKYYSKAKDYNYSYSNLCKKEKIIESDMLPGRGTLIPKGVFDEIGLFDAKNFPQYAADEDFALRARRKGWRLIIPTDVYVKSHIAQTGIDLSNVQFNVKFFRDMFFSIRSPLNLKICYRFALKNTRLKVVYFIIGLVRVSLSLTKGLIVQGIKKSK